MEFLNKFDRDVSSQSATNQYNVTPIIMQQILPNDEENDRRHNTVTHERRTKVKIN
jgi:hypothetical protein